MAAEKDPSPSYLNLVSPEYLEQLTEQYATDPSRLPLSWRLFFDGVEMGQSAAPTPSAAPTTTPQTTPSQATKTAQDAERTSLDLKILALIEGYRQRGHLAAQLDPLGRPRESGHLGLDLKRFELQAVDGQTQFAAAQLIGRPPSTLPQIVEHLQQTYCGPIGVEYMHISDDRAQDWLEKRMEPTRNRSTFSVEEKKQFFIDIAEATLFEEFLQKSFTGQKRFSLEGAEPLLPALKQIIRRLAENGTKETVIGMAHRGRLNVLVNAMRKPLEDMFSEFFGATFADDFQGSGDVKYHMGYSAEVDVNGSNFHMSLAFNPSHLEAIDPVVQGMAHAKQNDKYGGDLNSIVPILIHGDAAVIGQGVVSETLNYSGVDGYATGGTLHIVINNQIGFTTNPEESRTTLYCTDFAKATQSPVLHVNGDDVEAVIHAVNIASDFRREFKRDVFVDIYCVRKYGHNEGDEPRFTQPAMYEMIAKKKNALQLYREQLATEGAESFCREAEDKIKTAMEQALTQVKEQPKSFHIDSLNRSWKGLREAGEKDMLESFSAPLDKAVLDQVVETIHSVPDGIQPLPKFQRMLDTRHQRVREKDEIDWAVAEQLAFGSLLHAGYKIRLSGQDSKRGTFSHRHIELNDAKDGRKVMPLRQLCRDQAELYVYNSPLSEYGILGFDFGYASSSPNTLTLWEAQFGDFANGAQVMIDQFIASSESKWRRMNGIVLLLPHGYEGQGPEHSSARLERFLQLTGEGNMQVAYPTTPAQFCHLLRRQVLRDFRKPLVVMSPKSPLRLPEVISSRQDFTSGQFENFLLSGAPAAQAQRLIFCSGKVYWDLLKEATTGGEIDTTAFVRVEQLYPLDLAQLQDIKKRFSHAKDLVWCQEEPQNMGAWSHFRLSTLDLDLPLRYAGRKAAASPATGSPKSHAHESKTLIDCALGRGESQP